MKYHKDNIFSRILLGELPCARVYENQYALAFMDIQPKAEGHILVVPRENAISLLDLSEEFARETIIVVQKLARAVQESLLAPGIKIIQMNGEVAGQTVFHCHFHVIPQYKKNIDQYDHVYDSLPIAELEKVAKRIRNTACLKGEC